MKLTLFFVFVICLNFNLFSKTSPIALSVIASGETHAMLEPCECIDEPGGGFAQRHYFLKNLYNAHNRLLVDAGGFTGGDLYDIYTEGKCRDSARTAVAIKAMGAMNYDAVAIGDDDLIYGAQWLIEQSDSSKLPLISANVMYKGALLTKPFRVIQKGNQKIAITAVVTQEKLLDLDSSITIEDPAKSLKKIWNQLVAESDFQIIISHTGQEQSELFASIFKECDLIINGHRKKNESPLFVSTSTIPILQFGYLGKMLSYADYSLKNGKLRLVDAGWHRIGPEINADSSIANLIHNVRLPKKVNRYEFYIMSQCPYGLEAVREFTEFVTKFPEIDWNIRFIGKSTGDTLLSSLHGVGEIEDEYIWLAVNALYPSRFLEFLTIRSHSESTSDYIVKHMKLDISKIHAWISLNGKRDLYLHYIRSQRLNINASPTLLINNIPYDKNVEKERLRKYECKDNIDETNCENLYECFDDNDCKKSKMIGKCSSDSSAKSKCIFRAALPFEFTVIAAEKAVQHPESSVIATTIDLFPGAQTTIVAASSKKGKALLATYQPEGLPFYLFDKDVKLYHNFAAIEEGLVDKGNVFCFKNDLVPVNYYYSREKEDKKLVLFVDLANPDVGTFINNLEHLDSAVTIVPIITTDPSITVVNAFEKQVRQEALRWLVLQKQFPDKFRHYLQLFAGDPFSSYWFTWTDTINIDRAKFIKAIDSNSHLIHEHWGKYSEVLKMKKSLLLRSNREMVFFGNVEELESLIPESIKRQ